MNDARGKADGATGADAMGGYSACVWEFGADAGLDRRNGRAIPNCGTDAAEMVAVRWYRRPDRRRGLGAMHMEDPAGEDSPWVTRAAPTKSERRRRPMQRAAKRFAEQLRREGTLHHRRLRRRWQAFLKRSRPKLSNGDVTRANRAEGGHRKFFAVERLNTVQEHTNRSDADLGSDAVEEMAKYGITCSQIDQFFYGDYRYTNLADAIAEAKRNPHAR